MPWWVAVAIDVFVVILIGGLAYVVVLAVRTVRMVRLARAVALEAIGDLMASASAAVERAEGTAAGFDQLLARLEQLERSLEQLSILHWGLEDARTVVRWARTLLAMR